jgi:cellulose biosynthesis protein BcsQ
MFNLENKADELKIKPTIVTVTSSSFKGGVGKITTALHLATYLQTKALALLVDGDLNRSALDWQRGVPCRSK